MLLGRVKARAGVPSVEGKVETQLKMAFKLGYIGDSEFEKVRNEVIEIRRMLFGVIKFLEKKRDEEEKGG